jgi:hypothetical protein
MQDPLSPFELDRLEAARLNSLPHRQASPNKRVLQLAFEDVEYTRARGRAELAVALGVLGAEIFRKTPRKKVLRKLARQIDDVREFLRRACRVERPGETEEDMRGSQ